MFDNIVGALAADLIKKSAINLYSTVRRLKNVSGAFADPDQSLLDEALGLSFKDLERVFGSYAGILTEPLHKFLVSLYNSSLPSRMMQMRILDLDAPGTRYAF